MSGKTPCIVMYTTKYLYSYKYYFHACIITAVCFLFTKISENAS